MSPRAIALQNLYRKGKVTVKGLKKAVKDGIITQKEYDIIVG